MHGGLRREREHLLLVLLEEREERFIIDDAVLDNLPKSRGDLPRGQRFHEREVDEDSIRLIEATDEILAERVVDGHLAANARINLREQARRQLDERHAAHIAARDEACEVADDAAAEREYR